MGVGCALLTEVKITDDRYTKFASGYKIISSKATSHSQGGIALLWKENHPFFEVEAATVATPNLMTFQLVTGYEQFYVKGIYIPPNDTTGWMRYGRRGQHALPIAPRSSWATLI